MSWNQRHKKFAGPVVSGPILGIFPDGEKLLPHPFPERSACGPLELHVPLAVRVCAWNAVMSCPAGHLDHLVGLVPPFDLLWHCIILWMDCWLAWLKMFSEMLPMWYGLEVFFVKYQRQACHAIPALFDHSCRASSFPDHQMISARVLRKPGRPCTHAYHQ